MDQIDEIAFRLFCFYNDYDPWSQTSWTAYLWLPNIDRLTMRKHAVLLEKYF